MSRVQESPVQRATSIGVGPMAEQLTVVLDGYHLRAGGKELRGGGYAPTLDIAVAHRAIDRIEVDIPVQLEEAFATVREAQERAFEVGMHWLKAQG